LRELLAAARRTQADLFTLDLACIAGHVAGSDSVGLQARVEVHQRAGDAMTHGTGLAGLAATMHVDLARRRFRRYEGQHQSGCLAIMMEVSRAEILVECPCH
jgi:hypothetical protein